MYLCILIAVELDGRGVSAMNVSLIQTVSKATVRRHLSVPVTRAGVVSTVIKVTQLNRLAERKKFSQFCCILLALSFMYVGSNKL